MGIVELLLLFFLTFLFLVLLILGNYSDVGLGLFSPELPSIPTPVATFLATLSGVGIAFYLDRQVNKKQRKKRALNHLKNIKKELEENDEVRTGHKTVINELQRRNTTEADHYTLDLYKTSAWDAALADQILDELPTNLYYDLYDLYMDFKTTNQLVRRLGSEALDPELGGIQGRDESGGEKWSQEVLFYDYDDEETDSVVLGALIKNQGEEFARDVQETKTKVDCCISQLEEEIDDYWV